MSIWAFTVYSMVVYAIIGVMGGKIESAKLLLDFATVAALMYIAAILKKK